ncbi:unnamed protein product [Owenia fusiformis]|uniref:Isopenicillin N synthase-like Fe(2+) 2OG dioxygenase domain-containing protein n=1 Tax=Owenia fusiformis TaxID=6347 RepID=A0A8S4PBK3_OWEFU|nr:unnamed protein product [Owenia fusiformis]
MALSLQQERTLFTKLHNTLTKKTRTQVRILNYPKMPEDFTKTENQMRLGEHTDWGTVTFIAQDNMGGLQPHRVVKLPCESESIKGGEKSRFSMIYFGNPDWDAVINSIDDSKYEPIKANDHLDELWNESFGKY